MLSVCLYPFKRVTAVKCSTVIILEQYIGNQRFVWMCMGFLEEHNNLRLTMLKLYVIKVG